MKHTEQRWMRKSDGHFLSREWNKPMPKGWVHGTFSYDEPEWEDVEVVRMYCPECQTVMTKKEHEQNKCCKNAVELRGTYRRRKPEPQVENYCPSCGGYVRDVERKVEG